MFAITPNILSNFMISLSRYVILLSLVLISVSIFLIIFLENDYYQGISFKIMFIHVPTAWLSLAIFLVMGISSIVGLIFKSPTAFTVARSLSPIGLIMSIIVLVTGSIWGNLTWGAYWVWDARLTSMIFLMFFYIALILALKYLNDERIKLKVTTTLSIIGFINVPIIRYSVDYLNTLHQPTSLKITGSSTIHTSFLLPLFLMLLVFLIYSALIFLMKYKTEIIKMKRKRLKNYD